MVLKIRVKSAARILTAVSVVNILLFVLAHIVLNMWIVDNIFVENIIINRLLIISYYLFGPLQLLPQT